MIRGRIDGTPAAVDGWARRFADREVHVAVEACTGWLFLCGALVAAGAVAHLAEPVETRALGGSLPVRRPPAAYSSAWA